MRVSAKPRLTNAQDPVLKQRVIRLIVDISAKALDKTPSFALKVLEHILMTRLEDHPQYPAYSEAVKELHSLASHELRKLSMRCADYFFVSHLQTLAFLRRATRLIHLKRPFMMS